MAASYKKLFKLLIDRDMKKKELAATLFVGGMFMDVLHEYPDLTLMTIFKLLRLR